MPVGPPRVLVADEGRHHGRTALTAVRALGSAGYAPTTTVAGARTLASSSRWCAGVVVVPPDDLDGWRCAVHAAAADVALVVPASDSAVVALGLPGAHLVDKRQVRDRAAAAGLRVPDEEVVADLTALRERAGSLPYPVVVKPLARTSMAVSEAVLVAGPADLARVSPDRPLVVQPFLTGEMRAFAGLVVDGRLRAAVHQRYLRIWPLVCGTASAAVSVEPDHRLEERVLELVRGHEGIVQVQLLDGHVIDVNPRAYGSMSLAVRAGANFPALWCDTVTGTRPSSPSLVRARVGVPYRWTDADVRSVWARQRAGQMTVRESLAALAPRRGTAHSIEDRRDPWPVAVRALGPRG